MIPLGALGLWPTIVIVFAFGAILSIIFMLFPQESAFSAFWRSIEEPPVKLPPPNQYQFGWLANAIVFGVAVMLIVLGYYLVGIIQTQLVNPCNPPSTDDEIFREGMKRTCQLLNDIIRNAAFAPASAP